ncbi:MAG: hypothetical protein AAFN77_19190 [Planctomycetota bacterium]
MQMTQQPSPQTQREKSTITPPAIVRAETNFLRFPFFALSTKNIHHIDFREVTGSRVIKTEAGESTVDFMYRVSRNTDHVFPGQLSRKIHFALLAIMAKQAAEPANPIRFTWRQLAREMGVSYAGGKMIRDMKQAIRSTHGAIIRTDHALIDGAAEGRPTIKRERGLHLYEDYCFQDETMSDGSTIDRNEVTLASWYFNNLKARYIQPLDFDLWLDLNKQTPIASRLYEYLVFVFGRNDFRKISYDKLAASIPLTPVTSLTRMKRQLEPAFSALRNSGLLKRSSWTTGKYGQAIISFQKGESMKRAVTKLMEFGDDVESEPASVSTRESLNDMTPTDRFIVDYYERRFGIDHVVTAKERKLIGPLTEQHGLDELNRQLPKLVRRMKQEFPTGATIMAAGNILLQLLASQKRTCSPATMTDDLAPSNQDKRDRRQQLDAHWATLSDDQRSQVKQVVIARLGNKSQTTGFQLMLLHEAYRLFFES